MTAIDLAAAPLQGLLVVSRLVRSGADLPTVLDSVARIVAESFGFGLVAVSLHRPAWDDFEVAAVHGGDEAREALLGQTLERAYWEPLLDDRFSHRGAQLVPKEARDWTADGGTWFVPASGPGDWDPADALLVPLLHTDGSLLGILSVNEPPLGRTPSDDEVDLLVAMAANAAQAIESAQDAAAADRHRTALEHLLSVSAELVRSSSTATVLQLVCDAIRDALGFRLAVIELADRDADRYRPAASAGLDVAHEHIQVSCSIDRFDSVFDDRYEIEGCYLLSTEEAHALVGDGPASFFSTQNGRGPLAWSQHWLLVPLHDRSGTRIGFMWADDPEDRLLPSRGRLQALRLFADQAAKALQSAEQHEALREAHERQAALLESSPLAIIAVDRENLVTAWNPAAEELFGWTADEVLGGPLPYLEASEQPELQDLLQRLLRGGSPVVYETARRRRDGRPVEISVSAAPLRDTAGTPIGVMSMSLDITARKRTEADLARRHAELEALHATTLELIERLEPEVVLETIVSRACDLLGTPNGSLYLVDPADQSLTMRVGVGAFAEFVGTRLEPGEGLAGRVAEEAATRTVEDYSTWEGRSPLYEASEFGAVCCVPLRTGGDVIGVFGVARREARAFGAAEQALLDRFAQLASLALGNARLYEAARHELDERRQAEAALRKSRELHRKVVETSTDLITLLSLDGSVVFASPSTREILGYEPERLVGRPFAGYVHPDDLSGAADTLAAALAGGRPAPYLARVRHRDGHWVELEGVPAPILGDDGGVEMLLSIARDVTERRRHEETRATLEEQLHQAQKMEAVGRLAGGIAHDFNNLLTAIGGYSEFALSKLPEDSPARRDVEEARGAAERAAGLTRQLLAFSRRQVLQPRVLDLNAIVADLEPMLRRLLGEDVELAVSLDGDLGATRADPSQVEQVLMNLAINARDAMPRGGRLEIATRNVELDEPYAATHVGAAPGEYVLLSVTDSGEGMDRETLDRIFEPFFTTKPLGKGTGLGLATVYGIVSQTGGHVWAYSESGRGAAFKVYLPRVADAVDLAREGAPDAPVAAPARAGETVLLVEDEAVVRELVQEMLARAGYSVLTAADGEQALVVAAGSAEPIDVLVTDVVMPGLSGREVADRLASERPGLRVLFTSGYTEDAIASHGVLGNGAAFLEKPFSAAQLAAKLRQAIDAS